MSVPNRNFFLTILVHVLRLFEKKVNQELVKAILMNHINSVHNNAKIIKKILKGMPK